MPLSKCLTLPQTTPSIKNKQPAHARVLTSVSAVELMVEKERKKQQELKLKDREKREKKKN